MDKNVLLALGLSLVAGLATGIGSCIAFFFKKTNYAALTYALGFSGGVMVYISFVELLADAKTALSGLYGSRNGSLLAAAAFFGGIILAMLIDKLVPEKENPHEVHQDSELTEPVNKSKLFRSGMFFALAIAIHNFPEGMAVFMSGMATLETGIFITLAIAIHNIPEGITVSVPIYQATGSRKKAFFWSLASGFAEPVGALTAYMVLMPFLSETLLMLLFAAVAGIMVFITFDELLPLSEAYGRHHLAISGIVSGMALMALVLAH